MTEKDFHGKIDSIQLLRVIASIGVALFHIQCFYATGLYLEFGVHLFFIISAFLVMYTTQKKPKIFLRKRLLRVLPLYWMLTIATFLIICILPNLLPSDGSFRSLFSSLFFIPYMREGVRAAEGAIRPLVGPAWTLNYEVFFTLVFAAAMKISHKYRGVIAGVVVLLLALCGKVFEITSVPLFFWTRDYWGDFAAGIIVFYILRRCYHVDFTDAMRKFFLSGAVIVMMIMGWGGFSEPRWLIFAFLGSVATVLFTLGLKKTIIPNILIKVGDMSYSFYLFHYYVIVAVGKIINLNTFSAQSLIGTVLILVITQLMACVSFELIEKRLTSMIKNRLGW